MHKNAPLSVEGRRRLFERCRTRPIAHVAAEMGISRATASKWVKVLSALRDAIARYYTTIVQGLSVQARDGASRADLEAVVTCAMAAWDGLAATGG